ncbi:hypothetical protein ACFY5C_16490 [Streptomyces sp. NPDC012935]|uniref:hypothetical protein n=1 Tax=Streptomyces sp. NPDC012935 TaxID=3364857 RepID=UPI0036A5D724
MRGKLTGLIGILAMAVVLGTGVMVHHSETDGVGKGVHILATNEGPGLPPMRGTGY